MSSEKRVMVNRALVSVSNKHNLVWLAAKLSALKIEILSTGGTAGLLAKEGVTVRSVDSYTGFPEIMDGRVKTLHPKIHGGLLAVRDNPQHVAQMHANGIQPIDLVVVNLYPFRETIAKPNVSLEEAIENIDIGGPAMIRSSAKNHAYVAVVVDPTDYEAIMEELEANDRTLSLQTRQRLAVKAFTHTAQYDTAISGYLSSVLKG
jgi:phosphoribosylaminoimidazolecarboxamide formyltransferase/IMP cyclohydrolase